MEESLQPLSRGEVMQTPDEVEAMLRLKGLGWGIKRIARELGCSHMTVRHYVAQGGWLPYRGGGRRRVLAGLEDWVAERFRRHAGNADVVRQELLAEEGLKLSLRTVERAVAALRRELEAEARATIRFETPPRQAAADRFWRTPGADRWRERQGVPVRRHPWLFAAGLCPGLSQRAPGKLVCRSGGRVRPLWRGHRGGAVRQRPRAGSAA
jgi:transposase